MIDRYEFFEKYGIRPTAVDSLGIGETYKDEKKGLFFEVKDFKKNEETGFKDSVTFFDGKEVIAVDLSAHWEKGPEGDIRFSRDGVMNLIRAVYAKTEEDYEALYLKGDEEIPVKPMPGESLKEFHMRRYELYKNAVAECEMLLGKLYIKYAKVKALWKESHDPTFIAEKVNDTPYHVAIIIDRLGLNRPNLPKEDDCDYRTVKISYEKW